MLKPIKHKIQRSSHKTDIFKVKLRRGMHYANFYDIFSGDLNRIEAQYFIENEISGMISCKRGHTYPTVSSYKLNWGETNPTTHTSSPSLSCSRIRLNVT